MLLLCKINLGHPLSLCPTCSQLPVAMNTLTNEIKRKRRMRAFSQWQCSNKADAILSIEKVHRFCTHARTHEPQIFEAAAAGSDGQ